MKKVLCIVLCVVILLSANIICFATGESVNGCNWMSVIADNTSLADISMPGTHDTAATYVAFGIKSRCQDKTIPEQLNCGARFLDIRLCLEDDNLKLVHNFINCRKGSGFNAPKLYFDDVSTYCIDFLKNNPKECIVMFIKEDFGSANEFDDVLRKSISFDADYWYTENRIPSLGEVRGKIVLMNRFSKPSTSLTDKTGGINLTNFPSQKKTEGSYESVKLKSFTKGVHSSYTVQDRYQYPKQDKWELGILPTFEYEKAPGELLINFLSTANGISPEVNAKYINANMIGLKLNENKCYGAVLFDFIDEQLAETVYSCNLAVRDSNLDAQLGVPSDVPKPQHAFVRFLDALWARLVKLFSEEGVNDESING